MGLRCAKEAPDIPLHTLSFLRFLEENVKRFASSYLKPSAAHLLIADVFVKHASYLLLALVTVCTLGQVDPVSPMELAAK